MVTTCRLLRGKVIGEVSPEPINTRLLWNSGHLLLVSVLLSEAKSTGSNNFGFLLPDLLMMILAVKRGDSQMSKGHIF